MRCIGEGDKGVLNVSEMDNKIGFSGDRSHVSDDLFLLIFIVGDIGGDVELDSVGTVQGRNSSHAFIGLCPSRDRRDNHNDDNKEKNTNTDATTHSCLFHGDRSTMRQ